MEHRAAEAGTRDGQEPAAAATAATDASAQPASVRGSESGSESLDGDENGVEIPDTLDAEHLEQLVRQLSRRSLVLTDSYNTRGDYDEEAMAIDERFSLERFIKEFSGRAKLEGIKRRHAGVFFRQVSVIGEGASVRHASDLTDGLLFPLALVRKLLHGEPEKEILHEANGVVRHGEMLLVLGRPGAGCSTLLKVLGGETAGFKRVDGTIHYNGISQKDMVKKFRGEVVYNPEVDKHFPHLTVSQTLDFAAATRAPRKRLAGVTRARYTQATRDVQAKIFGLTHTFNTKVGNDFVRGVSGGERKRVSLAEMMSTRAVVQMWDNSTRGLDASTALEFANTLRVTTNLLKSCAVIAIYQAGEAIYECFDKVTVLYEGRQIFFGPAERARQYFIDMGFEPQPRQTSADFLTAVTDPKGRFFRKGMEDQVPRTPDEFVVYWKNSTHYRDCLSEMDAFEREYHPQNEAVAAFKASTREEKDKRSIRKSGPYTISYIKQIRLCIRRSYQRTWGDKAFIIASTSSSVIQALIIGSVFYNIPKNTTGFFSRGGVLFFSVLFNAIQSMSEIATQYEQRPIVQRHKSYALYHPSAETIAQLFADLPIRLVTLTIFDVILYFMTGLYSSANQFFIFYLFTFVTTIVMVAFFRMLAAVTRDMSQAHIAAGVGVLAIAIYTGYVIPRTLMRGYFRWISYINPVAYGFEALMANEFYKRSDPCASLVPSGPGYEGASISNQVCAVIGAEPGSLLVSGARYIDLSYGYTYDTIWRNLGILIGFWFFFVTISCLAVEYMGPTSTGAEVLLFKKGKSPALNAERIAEKKEDIEANAQKVEGNGYVEQSNNNAGSLTEPDTRMHKMISNSKIFTWQDVNYTIKIKKQERKLLDGVNGYVKPGTLTALMGESGAGKTTLLNVLAQRVSMGVISGEMLVNGRPIDEAFQRSTGYVQQQDVHSAELTVREALRFSAMLRQPSTVSREEKYRYAEEVIELLEMGPYADAIIGVPGEGLNVEQRKKVSIGVELAAKPELLLFLDEPTSGLDSQSSWAIMLLLRKLANAGQAILCTIHQPSSVLFSQFDRLLLLRKGGQTVYFGDLGKDSETLLSYFERNGAPEADDDVNPAEYILDAIGAGATAQVDRDWHEIWKASPEYAATTKEISNLVSDLSDAQNDELHTVKATSYAMPLWVQIVEVTKRAYLQYWRKPRYIWAKLMLSVVTSLFIGFTFFKANLGVQNLQNKLFAVFMSTIASISLINQLQPEFIELRNVFEVREKPSKAYSWIAFAFSAIVVEIPFNVVASTLFYLIWYYLIGYYSNYPDLTASRGFYGWLLYALYALWFPTFGQMVAAGVPNAETAAIINGFLFAFVITFNGVLQPPSVMPKFWSSWMYHLTPFTYIIGGMLSNVVGHGVPVICQPLEFNIFQPPTGSTCQEWAGPFVNAMTGYLQNPSDTSNCQYCRFSSGDQFLATVSMNWNHRWRNYGILWGYVVFNICMTLVILYLFRIRQWSRPDRKVLKIQQSARSKEHVELEQEVGQAVASGPGGIGVPKIEEYSSKHLVS